MYPIRTENELCCVTEELWTMPDGVRLYTRYCVPKGVKSCPIIYMRTPYEDARYGAAYNPELYSDNLFLKHGYAVLLQHCRGRGDSEGECVPYEERNDGLETLKIIRTLPFYNGEIYITGGSYLATVHLSYLSARPKDIKGICLEIQTDRMYYRNHKNGCNYNLCNAEWWGRMLSRRFPEQKLERIGIRPYSELAERVFGAKIPEYTDKLIHNTCDEFWTSSPSWFATESLEAPTLLVDGWYDFYIDGMMNMWERLSEDTKARSAMIIGPYGHATRVNDKAEYPLENGNIPEDYIVEWFDSIRYGRVYKYASLGKLTYYSIARDEWLTDVYPRSSAEHLRLWFGKASELLTACAEGETVSYIYDPDKPSGCYKFGNVYKAHKPGDADGVVSFFSKPFEKDESFFGRARFHLNVSSDCSDTAFFVRLYFVDGDESYNLTEAVGSLSYFWEDYTPGEMASLELETSPIAFTARRGMKIRVDVSSESGIYVPHANVKGHFAYVTETRVAKNSIYTEGSYLEIEYDATDKYVGLNQEKQERTADL